MDGYAHKQTLPTVSALAFVVAAQAILQMLDLTTTYMALQDGAIEANPISRALIEQGWGVYGAVKVALAAAFLLLLPLQRSLDARDRRIVMASMTIFAVLMGAVVANNAWIVFGA